MTNYAKWDRILRELEEDDSEDDTSSKPKSEQLPPLSHKPFQLKQEIHEAAEKLHKLEKDLAEYEELGKVVKDLPLKLDHEIMVPLGKQAFIPGKIIHANEILAHLGGEHFAKKTASETYDMVERKKKNLTKQIERQETWLKSLHEKLGDVDHVLQLKKIYEDANIQEIKETEEESNEVFDASEFTQEDYDTYFEIEKQEAEKLASSAWDWDEAMRRLEELEQNEDGDATEEKVPTSQVKINEVDQVKQQGNAAFASANYSSALELYTKAIDLAPMSHTLFGNRSAAHYHLKQFAEAKKDAEQAISIDPTWAKGHFRLGQALAAMGHYEDAAKSFEEAARLKPSDKSSTTMATEMRQKAENAQRLKQLSARDKERSSVFTGTVVERGQNEVNAGNTVAEQPPKRVSRFKAMRQGQQQ